MNQNNKKQTNKQTKKKNNKKNKQIKMYIYEGVSKSFEPQAFSPFR